MCESTLKYRRTPEEKLDKFLAWKRENKTFFASGACHILAHMFLELHHNEGYDLVYIKPKDNFGGSHLYASNGVWAFDFNGWTLENDLLEITVKDYSDAFPGWDYEKIILKEGLVEFLKYDKTHRPPEYFPYLPWERAYKYIQEFKNPPPNNLL